MNSDIDCSKRSRLSGFLEEVKNDHPDYYCKPVPPFGNPKAKCLIVGLAPGRPFTGDHAGILLYQTLYDCGLSTKPVSTEINDGLRLVNCKITNAVKCLPPQNKPTIEEIYTCNQYLKKEIADLSSGSIILALGKIAHRAVLKTQNLALAKYKFVHGQLHKISENLTLIDSYHCSRYNTQTKRLTPTMFREVFDTVKRELSQ